MAADSYLQPYTRKETEISATFFKEPAQPEPTLPHGFLAQQLVFAA